jgi:hypothetical protein
MNIRYIIKAILVAGTLVAASSASAKSDIDAFKNIPSHDIPKVELDAVSGDGVPLIPVILGVFGINPLTNYFQCGSFSFGPCTAYAPSKVTPKPLPKPQPMTGAGSLRR